ncbi:MAG: Hpt domain-containing protein [Treponema sp.]|nr:Hpt domain-containing protein [Treponema sp.]
MSTNKTNQMNMETGLAMYGGDMETLITVVESFVSETPAKLDKIRLVTQENLQDYFYTVHGLKNASATLGADEVSRKAKKLENAAREGELSVIFAENSDFIKDIETLVKDAKGWLDTEKKPVV